MGRRRFWKTTVKVDPCMEAPDGRSHTIRTHTHKWRFWSDRGWSNHDEVSSGPCPIANPSKDQSSNTNNKKQS